MLFVALGRVRSGTIKERVARRIEWKSPEGLKPIAEYWLQGEPSVISIAEADSVGPIMAAISDWDDVISWTVLPAISAEQGLEMAKGMVQG